MKFIPLAQVEISSYGMRNPLFEDTILDNTVRQVIIRIPQTLTADIKYAIEFDQFFDVCYNSYEHANYALRLKAWINGNMANFFRPLTPGNGPFAMALTVTCAFETNSLDLWTKPSLLLPTDFLPDVHSLARLTNLPYPNHMHFDPRGLLERVGTITYNLEPVPTELVRKLVKPWTRAPYMDTDPEYLDKLVYSPELEQPDAPPADDTNEMESPRLSLSYDEAEDLPVPAPKKLCIGLSSQITEEAI